MTRSITYNPALSQISRNVNHASKGLGIAQEQLASGKRISDPSCDPGSAAVGKVLSSNIAALQQASRNVSEGMSVTSMMLGYLGVFQDILVRMKTLATESNSGGVSDTQRVMLNQEYASLKSQIDSIANNANWLGNQLFNTASTLNFQIGDSASNTISLSTFNMTASNLGIGSTAISTQGSIGSQQVQSGVINTAGGYTITQNSGCVSSTISGVLVRESGTFYYSDTYGQNYSVNSSGTLTSLGGDELNLGSSSSSYIYNLSAGTIAEQTLAGYLAGAGSLVLNPSSGSGAAASLTFSGANITGQAVNFSTYSGALYHNATISPDPVTGSGSYTGIILAFGPGNGATGAGVMGYLGGGTIVNNTSSTPINFTGFFIMAPPGREGVYNDGNGHSGQFNFLFLQPNGSAIAVTNGNSPVTIPAGSSAISITANDFASLYRFPSLSVPETFQAPVPINPSNVSGVIGTISRNQVIPSYAIVNGSSIVSGSAHNIDFSVSATLYTNAGVTGSSGDQIQSTGPVIVLSDGSIISQEDGLHAAGGSSGSGGDTTTAQEALPLLDTAIQRVASAIASVGAAQSQLRSAVDSLSSEMLSLSSARATVEDIDVTDELMKLSNSKANFDMALTMLNEGLETQKKIAALVLQAEQH